MDFSKTAELLASAAGRALGAVINRVKFNKDLGYNTYSTLINSCVVPILLYGSGCWGVKQHKVCEDVLLRAMRFYMGVHRLAAIPGIVGDMGWTDCKDRWAIEIIRLYNRFIAMDESRLNKSLFLYDLSSKGYNWSKRVKKILDDCDMINLWNNNIQFPLEQLKASVNDWEHKCSTKPKLRTYMTFKQNMTVASHLCCNMPKYERSLISQLRLGILPLRIETGRYSNLNVEDRTCLICESNDVENEEHFLFECNYYLDERTKFENDIGRSFDGLSADQKFKTVFEHPFRLARYIKAAISKRKQKLYRV